MEGAFYTAEEHGGRNELNVYAAVVALLRKLAFPAPLSWSAST